MLRAEDADGNHVDAIGPGVGKSAAGHDDPHARRWRFARVDGLGKSCWRPHSPDTTLPTSLNRVKNVGQPPRNPSRPTAPGR